MKKLIIYFLLILFPLFCFASDTTVIVVGQPPAAGGGACSSGTWYYPGDLTAETATTDGTASITDGTIRATVKLTVDGDITWISVYIDSIGTATEMAVTAYEGGTHLSATGKSESLSTGWNDIDVANVSHTSSDLILAMIPDGTMDIGKDTNNNGRTNSDNYADPMDWTDPISGGWATWSGTSPSLRVCIE
jgi:hypothetical protein